MTAQNTPSTSSQEIGTATKTEILNQVESWHGASDAIQTHAPLIREFFIQHAGSLIALIGCGSPYYLNLTAAAAYRALAGHMAVALPASEVLFNMKSALPGKGGPLVVAVSRSGETSELIAACRKLKDERNSPLLAISVSRGTTLEKMADLFVHISNADEKSMAQTRSFSAMLLTTLGAMSIAAQNSTLTTELRSVPALAQDLLTQIQPSIAELIKRGFERVFFLGSGLRYGLANEGSLKMKEMSITDAEPFHFMEFRHGPQSMVDGRTLVVGLVSQSAAEAETQVLREMVGLGGTVIAIGPEVGGPGDPHYVPVELPAGLSEVATLPFYMPAIHLLAYNQAMRKGLNCDSPRNLHAWIKLPELDKQA